MDTVTLSRVTAIRSQQPSAALPEAATPALLVVGGAAAVGGALLAQHRRRSRLDRLAEQAQQDVAVGAAETGQPQ